MGFIKINEGFTCEVCRLVVPPAQATCRNHCTKCLSSKHVDDTLPGDRASMCKNTMKAIGVEGTDMDRLNLLHECTVCKKIQRNKIAPDDDRDAIFALIKNRTI